MKVPKSLYSILQYFSTIDDAFAYMNNGYMVAKDKVGSGFVEVKAPEYFFKEQFIVKSMSKLLKLLSYDRKDKNADPLSIQEWTLGRDTLGDAFKPVMYIDGPGKHTKITQGLQQYVEKNGKDLVSKFDTIELFDSVKFQLTNNLYKQIISDCSLLDLDTITLTSDNDEHIKIYLTKSTKGTSEDYSSFDIECQHEHKDTKIKFQLSAFSLIDATDHQIEFGKFNNRYNSVSFVIKVRSFCESGYIVNRVILGQEG